MNYHPFVFSVAQRYASHSMELDEIINDVFLKVFSRIRQYNDKYAMVSWIKKITVNLCIDRYRSSLKNIQIIPLESEKEPIHNEEVFWYEDDFENIQHIIKQVPVKYRLIFNLYVFEDYSHKEIAHKLNIAIGTSKSAVSRSKAIIRNYYLSNPTHNEYRQKTI